MAAAFGDLADARRRQRAGPRAGTPQVTARQQLADAFCGSGDPARLSPKPRRCSARSPSTSPRGRSSSVHWAPPAAAPTRCAYRRAYDELSAVGLEPSHVCAPPRTRVRGPDTCPALVTCRDLLGRDADLAALSEIVDRHPLVTIVGPGGVGKTALAREVVRRRGPAHGGGVRVVELAAVSDPSAVPDAVVTALGMTSDGSPALTLLRRARSMDLVVLMDNCEHVLDAVCEVLDAVLGNESRPCGWSPPAGNSSACPPNTPGRCAAGLLERRSPAQQVFRRRAEAARPGAVPAPTHAISGDRATARRTSAGHRTGRRAGRHPRHRRRRRTDRRPRVDGCPDAAVSRGTGPCVPPSNGHNACCP